MSPIAALLLALKGATVVDAESVFDMERSISHGNVAAAHVMAGKLGLRPLLGPAGCLEWSTSRALTAGAIEDEMADVLLAIAPVAGLGRAVCAAPDAATALEYDITAGLEEPDDHR